MYIKRNRDEVKMICIENAFGGHGKVYGRQLLGEDPALTGVLPGFPDEFDSNIHFIHETILDVGTLVGMHPHETSEEVYFFVQGSAKMIVDGEEVNLHEGDVILSKKGCCHSIENTGNMPLKIVVVEGGVK